MYFLKTMIHWVNSVGDKNILHFSDSQYYALATYTDLKLVLVF